MPEKYGSGIPRVQIDAIEEIVVEVSIVSWVDSTGEEVLSVLYLE